MGQWVNIIGWPRCTYQGICMINISKIEQIEDYMKIAEHGLCSIMEHLHFTNKYKQNKIPPNVEEQTEEMDIDEKKQSQIIEIPEQKNQINNTVSTSHNTNTDDEIWAQVIADLGMYN